MISSGAFLGGQALNATGIGNNITESQSASSGLGLGYTTGSSYQEGSGSNWGYEGSESSSDAWSKTYGTEASAKDIQRAKEANDIQYEYWKAQANYNASEAQKVRDWQEKLANTAYQRTVKDLIAAGLNPYLAATSLGGAATPAGAVATSGLSTAHKATTYPDQESKSHSESNSYGESGGSNYSVGGSNNYGINFEINSGKSSSTSEPALGKIITNAVKTATNSASAKTQYDDRGFKINNSSAGSWKGFESAAYE